MPLAKRQRLPPAVAVAAAPAEEALPLQDAALPPAEPPAPPAPPEPPAAAAVEAPPAAPVSHVRKVADFPTVGQVWQYWHRTVKTLTNVTGRHADAKERIMFVVRDVAQRQEETGSLEAALSGAQEALSSFQPAGALTVEWGLAQTGGKGYLGLCFKRQPATVKGERKRLLKLASQLW